MKEGLHTGGTSLRYAMLIPLTLMIASFVSCGLSYHNARQSITDDLNSAMIALTQENSRLWTRQDTISAMRHTRLPLLYPATDINFKHNALRDNAYFTIALVDKAGTAPRLPANKIASDSIMLVPEHAADGLVIQVQGFANCSMASIFVSSNQTLSGVLMALSLLSMASMLMWRRKPTTLPAIDDLKLTPMQRQLTQMLLDAPEHRVDKATLCATLWGNKINAEESLYTLVRRTKTALADAGIEIICNRGDSYELRVNA